MKIAYLFGQERIGSGPDRAACSTQALTAGMANWSVSVKSHYPATPAGPELPLILRRALSHPPG
jgi:hypothetical protein